MKKVLNQQDVTDQLERFGMVVRDKDFFKNSEEKLEQFLIKEEVSDEEKVEDKADEVIEE